MFTTALAIMVTAGILAHSFLLLRDQRVARIIQAFDRRLRKLETAVFDRAEHARDGDAAPLSD